MLTQEKLSVAVQKINKNTRSRKFLVLWATKLNLQ